MSCVICNSDGPTEAHHVAPRRVGLNVTVLLCVRCHRRQTMLQHRAGVFRSPPGDGQRTFAILHGLAALLTEQARAAGIDWLATLGERQHRAMLRLVAAVCDERLGGNPIASIRHSMPAAPTTMPPVPAMSNPDGFPTGIALVLQAIGAAVSQLAPVRELVELSEEIAANASRIARAVGWLEEHPRARTLDAAIRQDCHVILRAAAALTAAAPGDHEPNSGIAESAVEDLRAFRDLAELWLMLLSTLAASSGPPDAGSALDRFLDRRSHPRVAA